ncbi:MAG TPA: DUF1993 domain-containing protein [Caulobacteraceae bacterium]|jgi:hypothetical protein|nr:DUF1993 domain-containing protein [Caulobacteraceae bacterium]
MPLSLYDASVPTYLQTLDAVDGFLGKGLAWARDNAIDPESIVETRIAADMHPFRFQVQSVVFHSVGAVEAIRSGVLTISGERPAHDYAGLQALVGEARTALRALSPEAVNARSGAEVVFTARGMDRVFTAEGFLLSFSLPNFYFHASMAYAILRGKGAPVGKLDYVGALRLKA